MRYKEAITEAMRILGEYSNTIFIGQGVGYNVGGTFMSSTLDKVSASKRKEFVVGEQFQSQFALGLSIAGYVPISIYVRQNFFLYGLPDLINMADKLYELSDYKKYAKIIIRTCTGPSGKISPGVQHISSFNKSLPGMFSNTEVIELNDKKDIIPSYIKAYERNDGKNTLLIENGDMYFDD